jgi:hypothetical protein
VITEEKLASFGAEKLARMLFSLYESQKGIRKSLDMMIAALDEKPKKIVSMIQKQISALKRSSRFIDYDESGDFAQRLDSLRRSIVGDLTEKSPEDALSCLLDFLDLQDKIFERCDDSNGSIGDVFVQACCDLGHIYEKTNVSSEDVANTVFTRFINNGCGVYDEMIENCKEKLGAEGLALLQQKFEQNVTVQNARIVRLGLQSIADCRKDVDAYIRACSFEGMPHAHDHLEIARRLIEHWRGEEALQWLDKMDVPTSHHWESERQALKVQALETCGSYDKAQDERMAWFERTLIPELYGEILKNIRPELKEEFEEKTLERVFQESDIYKALYFLWQAQYFDELATLVYQHFDVLDGRHYRLLRPVADILKETDPLAGTLVYRKLLESVLQKAQSKYYAYAAKDLMKCKLLKDKITDWKGHVAHDQYHESLLTQHKRKVSFWPEYTQQLQAYEKKQQKRKIDKSDSHS